MSGFGQAAAILAAAGPIGVIEVSGSCQIGFDSVTAHRMAAEIDDRPEPMPASAPVAVDAGITSAAALLRDEARALRLALER